MGNKNLVRNVPLKEQLLDILKARIRSSSYPPESLFPSEADLVAEFSVSRATIRSALAVLEAEGQIVRKHGVGTFVSKISKIKNPINRPMEFTELISSGGFEPGVKNHSTVIIQADDGLASDLSLDGGSQIIRLHKTFTADNEPAITLYTSIPAWLFDGNIDDVLEHPENTEPFFDFLEERCGQRVEKMVATFWPDNLQNSGFHVEKFDLSAPVLMMEYIAYNHEETPIFHSLQAYLSKHMKFNLIRLRDDV